MRKDNFLKENQIQGNWLFQMVFLGRAWRKRQSLKMRTKQREDWSSTLTIGTAAIWTARDLKGPAVLVVPWVCPAWVALPQLLSSLSLLTLSMAVTRLLSSYRAVVNKEHRSGFLFQSNPSQPLSTRARLSWQRLSNDSFWRLGFVINGQGSRCLWAQET